MKKKSLGVLAILLLLVGAGVYTYARYTTSLTGNANVEVAKWAVKVTDGTTDLSEAFNLALTLDENDFVANGKIAPGRNASGKVVLDLTGTEVDTDYEIKIGTVENIPANAEVVVEVGGEELAQDGTGVFTGKVEHETIALGGDNAKVEVTITVTWPNVDGTNDTTDTTDGEAAATLTIPVTVTAKQHIG